MQITASQSRMARSMLKISTAELAQKIGLTAAAISRFENGNTAPHSTTIDLIATALEREGAEFMPDDGVRRRNDKYRELKGQDCWIKTLDDVFLVLHEKPGAEALFFCVDDTVSTDAVRLSNLRLRDAGIRCRYICSEKATRFDYDRRDYRAIPARDFANTPTLVYGVYVATLHHSENTVGIVRDEDHAAAMRGMFEFVWRHAKSVPEAVS